MAVLFEQTAAAVQVGETVTFSGWADDFTHGVGAIEFSLDGGTSWTRYACTGARSDLGLTWQFAYTPRMEGTYVLLARAVAPDGTPQGLASTFAFIAHKSTLVHATNPAAAGQPPTLSPDATLGPAHVRALDGGPLQGARLFRSADISGLTQTEALFMRDALGIRTVYDLRSASEVATAPTPAITGVRHVALSPEERRRKNANKRLIAGIIGKYGAPEERMCANYRKYVDDYPALSSALRSICASTTGALIHCVNGKDRTGVLAAVIERACGTHPNDIMQHYLAANTINAAEIAEEDARLSGGMTAEEHAMLRSFLEARPAYLHAFFQEVEARHSSFEAYLAGPLHITAQQRETLQQLMARTN